jgi:phage terminase Nu1 subunit (DNA packaging protein)
VSSVERALKLWAIQFSNGWQYTPSEDAARDAERQGLPVVEYVTASSARESLAALEWVADRYAKTLAGRSVRDADEALDHARWVVSRARGVNAQ